MLSSLGGPDRHDGVEHTSTPAIDQAGEDHPGVVLSRGLKAGANDTPSCTESDSLDTAIAITE